MEEPQLDKVIEKLEKLDIRAWKLETRYCFITKVSGLTVRVFSFEDLVMRYKLELVNDDGGKRFSYTSYNKSERGMLKSFYEKICKEYDKLKEEEFEEMINRFLSD